MTGQELPLEVSPTHPVILRLSVAQEGWLMPQLCVIFDLDGTLVDSESLCNKAFIDLLPELSEPVHSLVARYRGWKLSSILADLARRIETTLPSSFEATYREHVAALFASELKAIPGVHEMLSGLNRMCCVASSGPPAKIRQALLVSGLASFFDDRLFSSYEVGSWKPEPDLFLHAADALGFSPRQCIVVEDSDAGVIAARAANMKCFQYLGDIEADSHPSAASFSHMSELLPLIDAYERGRET